MILFITKKSKEFTIQLLLETLGKELVYRIRLISYEELFRMRSFPVGTYVFTDLERLAPEETDNATVIWNTLSKSGKGIRLLNHPARSFRRFELLRHLYAAGVNDFNVYRLTDSVESLRYPVFVRAEGDHLGSMTPLLYSERELDNAVEQLMASGHGRDDKIIVEFTDTKGEDGIYRLYNDYIIGSRIVPRGFEESYQWMNKGMDSVPNPEFVSENQRYVETNPHEDRVRPIFELAGLEYGRIDYAVVDGQIRVFEINTNPYLVHHQDLDDPAWRPATVQLASQLVASFQEIDDVAHSSDRVPQAERLKPHPVPFSHVFRMSVHRALRVLHLLRLEAPLMAALRAARRFFRSFVGQDEE